MLESIFRNNGERRVVESELRDLLAEVREERDAVREERAAAREELVMLRAEREALRAQVAKSAAAATKLSRTNQALDEVGAKAEGAMRRLEALAALASGQEEHLRQFGQLDQRLAELRGQLAQAEQTSQALLGPAGSLAQVTEAGKEADKRIAALHALAEHVSGKAKALEAQRHAVDHAVTETARLNQLVWTMDAQVTRLTEGREQMQRAEEAVERIERLARGATQELEAAQTAREEFARESGRLESQGRSLLDALRGMTERLVVGKEEFGAFDDRLRSLSGSLVDAETRMQAVLAQDESFAAMQHKTDALVKVFADLRLETEDLARRQSALDELTEQLGTVEALGRRTAAQHDALMQAQGDLDGMRTSLGELQRAWADAARLRDKAAEDRSAMEAFIERTAAMIGRTPEIEARLDAMLGKMSLLEQSNETLRRLGESTGGLDAEVTRVSARMQFVETVGARVNDLYALSGEVERRIADQVARRGEIDGLAQSCDTLGMRLTVMREQLDGVGAQQARLVPLAAETARLGEALQESQRAVAAMKKDEVAAIEQQQRLAGLIEHGMRQAAETAERLRQVQALSQDVGEVSAKSSEMLVQLAQVQGRQRDVLAQVTLAEEQMQRAEAMSRQLDHRRTLLMHAEKALASFEARLVALDRHGEGLDQKMKALADREALVHAVKGEVDGIRQLAARSKADLQFVAEQRGEIAEMRQRLDDLHGRAGDTEQLVALIEAWRKKVEEVQASAQAVDTMFGAMQGTLESLSEQRVVIDDVGEKLARLDFSVQEAKDVAARLGGSTHEAQGTLRTLQREREVAERVEKSIKAVRAGRG